MKSLAQRYVSPVATICRCWEKWIEKNEDYYRRYTSHAPSPDNYAALPGYQSNFTDTHMKHPPEMRANPGTIIEPNTLRTTRESRYVQFAIRSLRK